MALPRLSQADALHGGGPVSGRLAAVRGELAVIPAPPLLVRALPNPDRRGGIIVTHSGLCRFGRRDSLQTLACRCPGYMGHLSRARRPAPGLIRARRSPGRRTSYSFPPASMRRTGGRLALIRNSTPACQSPSESPSRGAAQRNVKGPLKTRFLRRVTDLPAQRVSPGQEPVFAHPLRFILGAARRNPFSVST